MHENTRILFNSDGGSAVLYYFEPPITPEQLCRVVDELEDTQVDVFMPCINFGADNFLYRTKVGRIYDGRDVEAFENDDFRKWAHNVRSLLEGGQDPLDIWARRTRELGMRLWLWAG